MKMRGIQLIGMMMVFVVFEVLADDDNFNLNEVANGIYVHEGLHASFDDEKHDDIANIGFIIGEKCVAVIDTGGSTRVAKQLLNAIKSVTNKPICYVINTHVHFDHVLGNAVFDNGKSIFVGHAGLADAINASKNFFLEEFKNNLAEFSTLEGIIVPTELVNDSLQIDLGNRILELRAWKTAHSHTDLTVLDITTNTMWLSDLLFIKRIPALDGSLKGWIKVIEEIEKQNFSIVIPGHGEVVTDWVQALKDEKDYLYMLLNGARKMISEGVFMEEIVQTLGQKEKEAWLLHEQHHKRNVTKAFTELEWE